MEWIPRYIQDIKKKWPISKTAQIILIKYPMEAIEYAVNHSSSIRDKEMAIKVIIKQCNEYCKRKQLQTHPEWSKDIAKKLSIDLYGPLTEQDNNHHNESTEAFLSATRNKINQQQREVHKSPDNGVNPDINVKINFNHQTVEQRLNDNYKEDPFVAYAKAESYRIAHHHEPNHPFKLPDNYEVQDAFEAVEEYRNTKHAENSQKRYNYILINPWRNKTI